MFHFAMYYVKIIISGTTKEIKAMEILLSGTLNCHTFFTKKKKTRRDNTGGIINDPFGQLTVPAGSDYRLILKFWDVRTDRRTCARTDTLCEDSDHTGRD